MSSPSTSVATGNTPEMIALSSVVSNTSSAAVGASFTAPTLKLCVANAGVSPPSVTSYVSETLPLKSSGSEMTNVSPSRLTWKLLLSSSFATRLSTSRESNSISSKPMSKSLTFTV